MKFLTYTNNGCIEICKNLIASARLSGISDDDFIVACIDKFAFEDMSKFHKNSYLFIDQELTEYYDYSQSIEDKFRDLMWIKLNAIKENYDKYGEICYTDCDVIFKQDPRKSFNTKKVLLQNEFPHATACAGFMVFNHDEYSNKFLQIVIDSIEQFKTNTGTDQELINHLLINKIIPEDYYEYLDKDKFLNGMCFHDGRSLEDAIIVHNNCLIGIDNKINRFKYCNLWYI
jgi:hypothetical protein